MAIDIGDAILHCLVETAQADAGLAKFGAEVPAKLAPAGAAINDTAQAVSGMSREMAVGMNGAVELGNVVNLAGETSRESMYQARGEAALLGEAFGIHLPRHVRSFIAELPGIGPALSGAFAATAVLFLVEALVQGIEKIQKWAHHAEEVAAAWEKVDAVQRKALEGMEDEVIKAEIKLDELTGNHLEALRLKLQLIDNTSLSKLESELEKIAQEADKAFKVMDRNWFQKLIPGFEGIPEVSGEFGKIKKSVDDALSTRTPEAFGNALKLLDGPDGEIQKIKDKLDELRKQQEEFEKARSSALSGRAFGAAGAPEPVDPLTIQGWAELKNRVEGYKAAIQDAQKAEQDERKVAGLEERKKEAEEAKKAAEAEFKLYKDIFVARQTLTKELDKEQELSEKQHDTRLKQELKSEEDAGKEKLQALKQQEEAAIAVIDGEMKAEELAGQQKAEQLKIQYDKGAISAQQYLAKLKELYAQDVQALRNALNQKEKLVILEAQNEAAQRGRILTTEDAKQLKGYTDLENKKAQIQAEFNNKFLKAEDQVATKLARTHATLSKLLDDYSKKLKATEKDLQGFGKVADAVLGDISTQFGGAIEQWETGQASFGAALEKALKQYLAQVSAKAAIDALYFLAWGVADTFWNPARAGADFAAAEMFGAIAAVSGGLAAAIPGGGSGSGSSKSGSSSASAITPSASTQPAQTPVQTLNVVQLGSGALVVRPTPAILAEQPGMVEGVIPLHDSAALSAIGAAIGAHVGRMGGGGGDIYITVEPGMNLQRTVHKISRMQSRMVNKGQIELKSSDSLRNTRRY